MADKCIDVDVDVLVGVPQDLVQLFRWARLVSNSQDCHAFLYKHTRTENHFETLMEHISRIATPHLVKWIEVGK